MSAHYVAVGWNRRKVAIDATALLGVGAYLYLFRAIAGTVLPGAHSLSPAILAMRAWGSAAFLLLSVVLSIGPLARLDRRFLPLLYNRRHLGVMTAGVAAVHLYQVLGFYHVYGALSPELSLLTFDTSFSEGIVPFPLFGMIALSILVLLAATSHDYWQHVLSGPTWKWLHMSVYPAYAAAVLHVLFGALQHEQELGSVIGFLVPAAFVAFMHGLGAWRARDRSDGIVQRDGVDFIDAGPIATLEEGKPRRVTPPRGERIALLVHQGKLSALHGVCAHQGGPLDEGRVVDGCLTCPWHGWQYRPEDGCSPPPFEERLPIYRVRIEKGRALVDPRPLPAGTAIDRPSIVEEPAS